VTAAVTPTTDLPVHREVEHVMGMPISLALRGRHAATPAGADAWAAALAELREADAVFSTYRDESWVSRLGRGEVALEECPDVVREVLDLGEQARRQSGGAFDVRRRGADGREVLDPSGVVKGWAVQRAAAPLLALEDTDVCLSAGGDMVCVVADPDRPAWRVGVEDPRAFDRVVAVVPVRNGAVATSGHARRGAHVVDARTGRAPTALASVTVVGPDLTWADIDATCALALGDEGEAWLRGRAGRSAVVVRRDHTVTAW
jgi:thiamine biosynthesis lipoprotein